MATKYKLVIALVVVIVIGVVYIAWYTTAGAEPAARAFVTNVRKGTSTMHMTSLELAKKLDDDASDSSRAVHAIRMMHDPEFEVRTAGFRAAFDAYACVAGKSADGQFYVVLQKVAGVWRVFEVTQTMPSACDGGD